MFAQLTDLQNVWKNQGECLLYTSSFKAFSDTLPSAPWGICEHAILGMDSKFPIWHVHLRLFQGSRILFLSGLHYCSSLVLQEFYNCKYENKNYGFGIRTLSFCQPGFAVEVRHIPVCFLQMVYCSCISNKMMIEKWWQTYSVLTRENCR